ncbi:hypothetical protein QYF61_006968, partial [Mycteria americana]
MASSGDQSFSSHFPGLVEHQDSKDFWLCIAIWPAAPGTLPVLLTGPQAGSDALQSKWAVGPWSDSTLAVLMPSSVLGTPVSPPESWAATIQLCCMQESPGQAIWSPFTISRGRGHTQMRAESSPHSPKCLPVPSPHEPTENQAQQQAMGILELLVPQAVDEGVHCWRNHRVENSHHQIQGCGGDGEGLQVGNHASTDKQGDHSQGIGHGFGESGGKASKVKNREVEEEEVHGGVEAVVTGYGGDDEAVAQEGSQVDAQEEPEVQELQL